VPVAEALHIDLIHFGVVIMLNMMIGLALPPHGLLLFVISNLTATSLADIFREVPIFIVTMIAMLLLVTFVPDLVLWLPRVVGFVK
jgi:TRAP-type C4-dicarboxylate transport system permease large subunit